MRSHVHRYRAVGLGALALACGEPREPSHPSPSNPRSDNARNTPHTGGAPQNASSSVGGADLAPSSARGGAEAAAESTTEHSTAPASTPPSAAGSTSVDQGLADTCTKLVKRAQAQCSKTVAGFYQSSCSHYQKSAGDCRREVLRALECQIETNDETLCAHGADHRCAAANRALKLCQHGSAPEAQTTAEDDEHLPPTWELVKDSVLGFSVSLPQDSALEATVKKRTWKGEYEGVTYYVAQVDAPQGKLDNQALVKAVVGYVGGRCQLGLKLRGQLEILGTTVVQYQSQCPDKSEWQGMLHLWNGKAVSTGYLVPTGALGAKSATVKEPFFYSFKVEPNETKAATPAVP